MPRLSQASDAVYVLKPRACRLRRAWWLGVHGLAAASFAAAGLPVAVRAALVGGVLAHYRLRRLEPAPLLLVTGSGRWSVPERRLYERRAGPRTAYTALWARLVLGHGPRAPAFVLLKAEYGAADWRRIQLALRLPETPEAPLER